MWSRRFIPLGCSALRCWVVDRELKIVERVVTRSAVKNPYLLGLFVMREAGPALRALKKLSHYDLLMVDGHGQLHPRRCGLASYLGVGLNKPTIRVAKSLLCGTEHNGQVEIEGEVLGSVIAGRKQLYVSVGHRILLEIAAHLVKDKTKEGEWLPELLRLADTYSRL